MQRTLDGRLGSFGDSVATGFAGAFIVSLNASKSKGSEGAICAAVGLEGPLRKVSSSSQMSCGVDEVLPTAEGRAACKGWGEMMLGALGALEDDPRLSQNDPLAVN